MELDLTPLYEKLRRTLPQLSEEQIRDFVKTVVLQMIQDHRRQPDDVSTKPAADGPDLPPPDGRR